MALYANLPASLSQYVFQFSNVGTGNQGAKFIGLVKDTELAYNFQQDIGSGGTTEWLGGKMDQALKGIDEIVTGDKLSSNLEMFTIKKVKSFSNPQFTVTGLFYSGLKCGAAGTIGTYKEFMQNVAKTMLPKKSGGSIASILSSNQTGTTDYYKLLTNADMWTKTDGKVNFGYGLSIGSVLTIGGGLIITNIQVKVPTIFDANSQPLVWEATFTAEYYKQITADEASQWFS